MTRSVLQSLKEIFSFGGAEPVTPPEPGSAYFSESEKQSLRQGRREAHARAAETVKSRGVKVHPRVAARKAKALADA